ncbi:MAG TPA: hypothetical protein VGQ76_13960 [Thermoanaerobaculia bacterium]|nr:hypothetical protein [Thermoanaerobaculia bacterium]
MAVARVSPPTTAIIVRCHEQIVRISRTAVARVQGIRCGTDSATINPKTKAACQDTVSVLKTPARA